MTQIRPASWIKRFLPHSLLGRSLLIILLPLVLLQAVALQIFYGSHLDVVSRRLAGAVAGELAQTLELLRRYPDPMDQAWTMRQAQEQYEINMRIEPQNVLPVNRRAALLSTIDADLKTALEEKV